MNRLNMEDFYDWHPEVEMASTMTGNTDGTKLVRLTAKLDFLDAWEYSSGNYILIRRMSFEVSDID